MTAAQPASPAIRLPALAVAGAALGVALWAYWATLADVAERWAHDPQYSHGYLVPGFALALLWMRREAAPSGGGSPSWWGLPVLAVALATRLFAGFYFFTWLDAFSLLPCLAGLVLMAGGQALWRWSWPAVLFLGFMLPLPYRLSVALTGPLQTIATQASTFVLQTIGMPALAEGNVILVNDMRINIIEACSGLRMLVIFFALSTAVALVARRAHWEKWLLTLSAVPIALFTNVVRISVTGILFAMEQSEAAQAVFHDLAGWLMMPFALVALGLELRLLGALFTAPPAPVEPQRLVLSYSGLKGPAPRRARPAPPTTRQPFAPFPGNAAKP